MTRIEITEGLKAIAAHYEPSSPNRAVLNAAVSRINSRVFREFYEAVKLMRLTQAEYFRSHTTDALNRSKKIEREVDELIRTIPTMGQPMPQALPGLNDWEAQ